MPSYSRTTPESAHEFSVIAGAIDDSPSLKDAAEAYALLLDFARDAVERIRELETWADTVRQAAEDAITEYDDREPVLSDSLKRLSAAVSS